MYRELAACSKNRMYCHHAKTVHKTLEGYVRDSVALYGCTRKDTVFFPASLTDCSLWEDSVVQSRELMQRVVPDFYEILAPRIYTSIYMEGARRSTHRPFFSPYLADVLCCLMPFPPSFPASFLSPICLFHSPTPPSSLSSPLLLLY